MRKTQLALLAMFLGIGITTSAYAHDSIGFSLNIGGPAYYAPPPVYYSPPPIVYYGPAPVYREYYGPSANFYYVPHEDRYFDNRRWRGHRGHNNNDDDD